MQKHLTLNAYLGWFHLLNLQAHLPLKQVAWYTLPPAGVGSAGSTSEMKVGQKWVTSASCAGGYSGNTSSTKQPYTSGQKEMGMYPAVTCCKGHKCHESMSLSVHKHHCIIAPYNT